MSVMEIKSSYTKRAGWCGQIHNWHLLGEAHKSRDSEARCHGLMAVRNEGKSKRTMSSDVAATPGSLLCIDEVHV